MEQVNAALPYLNAAEVGLNLVGYVPLAGTFSAGLVRGRLGQIQLIAGLATSILGLGLASQGMDYGRSLIYAGGWFAFHGLANVTRTFAESVPGLGLVLCLPYDAISYAYCGGRLLGYQPIALTP